MNIHPNFSFTSQKESHTCLEWHGGEYDRIFDIEFTSNELIQAGKNNYSNFFLPFRDKCCFMVTIQKTYIMSLITLIYTPPLEWGAAYWLVFFLSRRLKVVLKGGWKPGAHFTIEKTFTVLDVTQADRVHVHAEPGMQLYPVVEKF